MITPITYPTVPKYQHTMLPQHRPPLRRDKPVRISIPSMPIRYIFPSSDRSFIFIPRAMRPNQQGFGRSRARGSFGGGYSGLGSSRRTSAYAGSNYSPSAALSRRSSIAREYTSEATISPGVFAGARVIGVSAESGKPIVRLPPAGDAAQVSNPLTQPGASAPTVNLPQASAYPQPQSAHSVENRSTPLPMHQPRPQKTVSVAGIESPVALEFNPPQQQMQQPFHQQVPAQVTGTIYPSDPSLNPHSRQPSHPSQASGGTPLSQIPERAIHAQPFQPFPLQPPPSFYIPHYPPPLYYFPHTDQSAVSAPSASAAPFVPGQYGFAPPMPAAPAPAEPTTQAGTVAHESNGMVYYFDSSQLAATTENSAAYSANNYPITQAPPMTGLDGMMTMPMPFYPPPAPAAYYPPQ